MSTPAGWYDDGSGRQRWWDGAQWTEHYAPEQAPAQAAAQPAPVAPAAQPAPGYPGAAPGAGYAPPSAPAPTGPRAAPVLGLIGLGLAVLGTILACIPTVGTSGVGLLVLLGALVVSLIAVFQKNTAKWPSIVGIILSVVGGVIGAIVFSVVLLLGFANAGAPQLPTVVPSTSEQPSDPSSTARPDPESIGDGYQELLHDGGITMFDDSATFFPCMGQFLFDSDLSDESLESIAAGDDVTGPERDLAIEVATEGTAVCAAQQ